MKLRSKKTGEIGIYLYSNPRHIGLGYYSVMLDENPMSIIEYGHDFDRLYQEWDFIGEDYEEPEEKWLITEGGNVIGYPSEAENEGEKIGNYFSSEEEAKLAVKKLKAWKRLKGKGFRFNKWAIPEEPKTSHIKLTIEAEMDAPDSPYDLELLFGGE